MNSDAAYTELLAHLKETAALEQVAGLLGWDQEVMMPERGTEARAEQAGALQSVVHARKTDPRIAELLDCLDGAGLDRVGEANIREARRAHERACRVPTDLASEIARMTTRAQRTWAGARADRDFAAFAPMLEEVLGLTRQMAECLQTDDASLYDGLLEEYEPGTTEAEIAEIFTRLRAGLTALRSEITENGRTVPKMMREYPEPEQMALARCLADGLGYDWTSGRLDLTTHPFMSGTRGDARITTRIDRSDPFNCLYTTIHETGHALYEQGLDPDLAWQPAGNSISMGVHESQSRLCENQIGRSAAYAEFLFPKMQTTFGDIGLASADDLYRTVNRVTPGFIRTEADEVHYNLHIMMRFDLERALISGDLTVGDLEAAWNDRFAADFGVDVPDAAMGVLQDVHWSVGLFGYFPTYTLGNIYAGALWAAIGRSLGDTEALVRAGNFAPVIGWLRENVHRRGSILMPRALIAEATGAAPSEVPLLSYLEAKFGALYGL